jgi:hypothetical protein
LEEKGKKQPRRGLKRRSGLEIADYCLQREGGSVEKEDIIEVSNYVYEWFIVWFQILEKIGVKKGFLV